MDVLKKIDYLRKEKGWSINFLAMEAGLTQSTLNNLYSRKTEPKIATLRAICDALGISLSDFFKEDENLDDELTRKIKSLTDDNKKALLQIINNMK
ncbi:MAG: helix-turn-helix domain-containing protein [Acutalibacteraceae bacterium]